MPSATCTIEAPTREHRRNQCATGVVDHWWRWLQTSPRLARRGTGDPARAGARTRRVLLISYQFPPTGGSGVQRPAKLAKYLPEHGWSIEVLAAGHDRFCWKDLSLLSDLPVEVLTHRVAGYEPACLARRIASIVFRIAGTDARDIAGGTDRQGRWSGRNIEDALYWRLTRWVERIGVDDPESLWIGPAARVAIARHRQTPFDAVISTGPPHFAHRVALRVAQATGLPWLADVRDPLVSDFDRRQTSARRNHRMRQLEQAIVDRAAAVVTTCPAFARDLQERYPQRAKKVRAITNGFDRDDIRQAIGPDELTGLTSETCVFVAAGSFYGRRELARIIEPLQQVLDRNPAWADRVRLVIAGTIDAEQRAALEKNTPAWVSVTGYLDHVEAIRLTAAAACNIIIVPDCEHGRLSIPGKTFELLALPAHVLALVPSSSDTAAILQAAGDASVVAFEYTAGVASAMERIIASHLADNQLSPAAQRDWTKVDAFNRRAIAAEFAQCLDSMCEERHTHQP